MLAATRKLNHTGKKHYMRKERIKEDTEKWVEKEDWGLRRGQSSR
jgi:hypothetical protein